MTQIHYYCRCQAVSIIYYYCVLATGGIQAWILSDKCSERKNLVSALLHPGFLHHWLWFAQILADTGQISREI